MNQQQMAAFRQAINRLGDNIQAARERRLGTPGKDVGNTAAGNGAWSGSSLNVSTHPNGTHAGTTDQAPTVPPLSPPDARPTAPRPPSIYGKATPIRRDKPTSN